MLWMKQAILSHTIKYIHNISGFYREKVTNMLYMYASKDRDIQLDTFITDSESFPESSSD